MSLNTIISQGYLVQFDAHAASEHGHYFCGAHEIPGAWCPNCDKPLLRLLTLGMTDGRIRIPGALFEQVHLFFCCTCEVLSESLFYRILPDSSIELIQFGKGIIDIEAGYGLPYRGYPSHFPGTPVRLDALKEDEQEYITLSNRYDHSLPTREMHNRYRYIYNADHQVGGEPLLWQGHEYWEMFCPMCKKSLPLLATIGGGCLDSRGLFGMVGGQIVYTFCVECSVMGAVFLTT